MIPAALILFAALNVADWWTTKRILDAGGFEANPAMRWVLEKWGFAGLAIVKAGIAAVVIGAVLWWPDLWPALAILCPAYVWVVWNNARVMRRMGLWEE